MLILSHIRLDIALRSLRSDSSFNDVKIFLRFEADQSIWKHETKAAAIEKFQIINQTQLPLDMYEVLTFQRTTSILSRSY